MSETDEDWENYESGPFCRHWGDPSDCDIRCAACGHRCGIHGDDSCDESGCSCTEWKEPVRP